ncbi:post-PEP-CTERM-1 domain-containing protein [Massilia sp. GCM10023247]|uniref:post-PEP-CTERM-1 domain-containing protein n=1 Tax=Massilia sp. GCM10023247 TaxID=3252643 RepID=UPI003622751A
MSHKKFLAVLPCAALWAALPPPAGAQQQAPQQPQQQQQGMVVVRDAQSGQLRAPTPAEIRALAPPSTSSRMSAPQQPALITHPGGSRQVRLGERGLVYSVVTRGADGKLAEQCVHGAAAADQAVNAGAPAAAPAPHNEGHRHE